jgi:hypothetical protein
MGDAHRAFERLDRPLLSITGTRDDDVVGVGATPERRMAVFAALPPGNKAHLVLQDADHMTFAGQTGRAAEIVPREAITRDLQAAHHGRGGRHQRRLVACHFAGRCRRVGTSGPAGGIGERRRLAAQIARPACGAGDRLTQGRLLESGSHPPLP